MIEYQETSGEAAESMEASVPRLEGMVLRYIKDQGSRGATCDEAEQGLNLSHQCCSARINGLMKKGIIKATTKRKTRSGRNAYVWIVS